jgi:hypothetical protein
MRKWVGWDHMPRQLKLEWLGGGEEVRVYGPNVAGLKRSSLNTLFPLAGPMSSFDMENIIPAMNGGAF